jgi:hypothetical protein
MPTLQDIIYSVVAGRAARFMRVFLLFLAVVGITIWFDLRGYKNFYTQESMDYAQLARNISENKGYTTQFIRPLGIYLLNRHANHKIDEFLDTAPSNRALWNIEQQEKFQRIINSTDLRKPHPDIYNRQPIQWLSRGLCKFCLLNIKLIQN